MGEKYIKIIHRIKINKKQENRSALKKKFEETSQITMLDFVVMLAVVLLITHFHLHL
jgi:hypothetical protein